MRCIITGVNGFIGSALKKRLEENGDVVIEMRREYYNNARGATHFVHWVGPDIIYHLGSYGNHYNQRDIKETIETNLFGTINMMLATRSVIPMVNVTSSSLNLSHQTAYSCTKSAAAHIASLFPNVKNVMPYSVYGHGEGSHRLIPTVIRHLLSGEEMELDEDAVHDWIYIDDFISAMLSGHTVIGTAKVHTNIEIVRKLEIISGKKLNYVKAEKRKYDCGTWAAPFSVEHIHIDEAMLKTYLWFSSKKE